MSLQGGAVKSSLPPLTAGIINHNGRDCIADTISSILQNGYPDVEVIVVDDCSTDGSAEMVRARFPAVKVFVQERNMGPNAARNRVMREAGRDFVFVTDNDITLAPGGLRRLMETMLAGFDVGVATPMVLDSLDETKIYSNGAGLHYTCFGVIPLRHEHIPENMDMTPRRSVCGSGGIMLLRKKMWEALGGFDEDFVFGYDDGEFTYRASAAGWKVMQVPEARIYHIEKPGRRPDRLRYQLKGRLTLILKAYSARSLFLLAPALLAFEVVNLSFLASRGLAGEWINGTGMVMGDFARIMEKRAAVMAMKKVPDKDLLEAGDIYMFPSRLGGGLARIGKRVFESALKAYWGLVRPLLTK
ncbi:MAG: glycosyltransferase family 2 protein [Nitrospinae bacterium]|nr:glycosyltransferase family 2 protein [Nitrospinota bacterium]